MPVLSCPLNCGHVSLNSQMLKDHLKSHLDNVKCPFCSMIIENIHSLPAHLDECSIKTEENIVEEENIDGKVEHTEGEYDTEIISILPDELTEEELGEMNVVNPASPTVDETDKDTSLSGGIHVKTKTVTPKTEKADSKTSLLKTYLIKPIEKKPKRESDNSTNLPSLNIGKNVTISRILKPPKVEVKSKTEANSDTDEAEDEIKEEEVEEKDEGESESGNQKEEEKEDVKEFLKLQEPESEEETEQEQEQALSPAVQEEVVTEDNNTDAAETGDGENVYHCSTCDAHFTDVNQHLAEYHSNQQVYLQLPEENGKDGGGKMIKHDPWDDDVEMSNFPSAANEAKDQAIWVNWSGEFYLSTRDPLKRFKNAKNLNYVVRPQTKNFSVSNLSPFYMEDDYGDKFFSVPVDTAIDYFEASNGRCGPKRFVGNFARVCIGSVVKSKPGSRPIQIYERVISTHSLSLTHILFSSMPPEHFLPIIVQMNPQAGCDQGIKYKIYWKCSLCEVEVDSWSLHDCDDVFVDMKEAGSGNVDYDINVVDQLTEDGEDKLNTNKENYDSEQYEIVQGDGFKKIKRIKPKKTTKGETPSITRHICKKCNIIFFKDSYFFEHVREKHSFPNIPKVSRGAAIDAGASKMGQFYCQPCKMTFVNEKWLQDHHQTDHRHKPGYKKIADSDIIQFDDGSDRTCTDCKGRFSGDLGLVFESRSWYLLHRKTAHGDEVNESELPVIPGRKLVAGLKAQFKTKKKGEKGYNDKDTLPLEPDEIVSSDGPLEPKILRTCSKCVRVKNSIYSLRKHLRDFHGDDSIELEEDDDEEKDNPSGSAKESPEDPDHDLYQIAEIVVKKEKADLYKFKQDGLGLDDVQKRYAENNVIEIDVYSRTCELCYLADVETPYRLLQHLESRHLSQFCLESFFLTRRRLIKLRRANSKGVIQVLDANNLPENLRELVYVGNDKETTEVDTAAQEEVDSAIESLIQNLEGDEAEEGEDDPPPKRRKFEILKENELPSKMRTKIKETSRSNNIENPIIVRDIGDVDLKGGVISDEPNCEEDRTAKLSMDVMDFLNYKEKIIQKQSKVTDTSKKYQTSFKKTIKLTGINAGKEVKHTSVLDFNEDPQTSCMTCKVTFVNTRWLERHKDCFHKNCSECPICTLLIQDQVMDVHMAGHNKSLEELAASYNGKHQKDIEFTCRECNHSFESEEHLSYHRLVHQNKVMLVHKEKCSYCAAEFYEPDMLRNHLKMHSSRRVYSCNYCNKLFYVLAEKVCHERIHTGVKPYVCEDCGKAFRKKFSLTMHKRHIHLNERRYVCDIDGCGQRFVSNSSLIVHKQRHDKTPRFKCKLCPKMFSNTGTRANHQRRKHYGAIEYVCKICTRIFLGMSMLRKHYAKHEALELKYGCHLCPQVYGRSLFLSKHMQEVHGEDSKL